MSTTLIDEQVSRILSGLRKSREVRPLQKEKLKMLIKDMALTYTEKGLSFRLIVNLWTLYRILDCIEESEELLKRVTYAVSLAMAAAESDEERDELTDMFKREVLKIAEEACI